MKSQLVNLIFFLLITGSISAQNNVLKSNFSAWMTKDKITRSFITPSKIIYQSENNSDSYVKESQVLLSGFDGQLSTDGSGMCVLRTSDNQQASIMLDFGHELYGGIEIAAAIRGEHKPVNIRVRFGESVSEAMSDCIDNSTRGMQSATNEHSFHNQRHYRCDMLRPLWLLTSENEQIKLNSSTVSQYL